MERKLRLKWDIYNDEIRTEKRYCHNCGKKVEFKDSLKRRQNSNGKNIFHFEIYKCPKGHTWNRPVETFKTVSGLNNTIVELNHYESKYNELSITSLIYEGVTEVEILLNVLKQKVRLDKFLSSKISDNSRAEIVKLINEGFVRINVKQARPNANLKEKDVVTLLIGNICKSKEDET